MVAPQGTPADVEIDTTAFEQAFEQGRHHANADLPLSELDELSLGQAPPAVYGEIGKERANLGHRKPYLFRQLHHRQLRQRWFVEHPLSRAALGWRQQTLLFVVPDRGGRQAGPPRELSDSHGSPLDFKCA